MPDFSQKEQGVSPRAAGPAGAQFEVSVGVHYALAVLAMTEAFGLPGIIARHIAFQRMDQGHPLDDIVLTGDGPNGSRTLEIQAKRSISFTKASTTFAGLVADMAEGLRIDPQRRFAIAIERTSTSIENGAQEALELARLTSSHTSFFELLNTEGRSNQNMRNFVNAFQHHLHAAGITAPEAVLRHLQSFSILHFDYARPNSVSEHTDRVRAAALSQAGSNAYGELFTTLMRADAIGGDLDRQRLIDLLRDKGIAAGGAPCLAGARRKISELSALALTDIDTTIAGSHILRTSTRQKLDQQLETARYGSGVLEVTGQGGVGKSALLKTCAIEHACHARILILAPDRTPPGGWPALQHQLGIDATAEDFLLDLACDGGSLVFIDGLDRFRSDGELKTVSDILTVAARTTGVTVLFTARPGWEQAHTLSEAVMQALKDREQMTIDALDDTEAAELAASVPRLRALLQPAHPAKALARNPFILKRFAADGFMSQELVSEASLAWQWWMSGGHGHRLASGEQLARRRILFSVVEAQLKGGQLTELRAEAADANAVASLIDDGVLTEISTDRVKFKHDLFTDWSIAAWISEDIARINSLTPNEAPAFWLARGVELAFRRAAEQDDIQIWTRSIALLQAETVNAEWIDLALLALVRSEQAPLLLHRHEGGLLSDKGRLAARLIWLVIGAHSEIIELPEPAMESGHRPPNKTISLPQAAFWTPLVAWLSNRFTKLPSKALSACIETFNKWILLARFGETSVTPVLLDRIADMLIAHIEDLDTPILLFGASTPDKPYRANRDTLDIARFTLAAFANFNTTAATRYLNAIAGSERGVEELHHLLEFPFSLPTATPQAFASALIENTCREYQAYGEDDYGVGRGVSLSSLEDVFVLSKCGISLFQDILQTDPAIGLDLVRRLTELTEAALETEGHINLLIAGEERVTTPTSSYAWSRGHGPSMMVSKALAAMEHWAHEQIEAGHALSDIVRQVAGEGPISGAFLLVIVDITLTHAALNAPELHDLMASPELLALDFRRYQHDYVNLQSGGRLTGSLRSGPETDQAIETSLAGKLSHHVGLHDALIQVALRVRDEDKQALKAGLEHGVQRLGRWSRDIVDWHSPSFMATHALRAIERENYRELTDEAGGAGWHYCWPEDQAAWLEAESRSATKAHADFNKSLTIRMNMDTETSAMTSTIEDAESILAGTMDIAPPQQPPDEVLEEAWLARIGAAAFLARAYPIEQLRSAGSRLLSLFDAALQYSNDRRSPLRRDVMFDPAALAFTGILYLYRDPASAPDDATLLRLVFAAGTSATAALLRHSSAARLLGEDRINACMRVGLQGCVAAHRRQYEETEDAYEMRVTRLRTDQMAHIQRELTWLSGAGTEPSWFAPPPRSSHWPRKSVRRPNRASKSQQNPGRLPHPDVYFDSYAGDEWLKVMKRLATPAALEALFLANREWLITANGSEESDTDFERYWTRPLFECAATIAKDWSDPEREDRIFRLQDQFGPKAFLNISAAFLLESDLRHIEGGADQTRYLAAVRQRIWQSLQKTKSWKHQQGSRDGRIEIDLHELVATLFIRVGSPFTGTTSYAGALKQEQLFPFAATLTELAASAGPCPTISSYLLDYLILLEPQNACAHLLTVARVWHAQAEAGFWRNGRIGVRVCTIVEKADINTAEAALWQPIASAIVADGVPEGQILRKRLKFIVEN